MPYATPATVREALAPEGDVSAGTAASLNDGQLNDAIAEATAEIDAKVSGAPFSDPNVPPIVAAIARDVAAYLATLTFRKGNPLEATHPVALRYARAEAMLELALKGALDLTMEPEAEAGSGVAVVNPYEGDLFTLDMFGLGIDQRVVPPWNDPVTFWPP